MLFKAFYSPVHQPPGFTAKLVRVMKLTTFLLVGIALHVSANTFSQTVTYTGRSVSLEMVFNVIEKQTGYVVFYDCQLIEGAPLVTINVQNTPLSDFLQLCLRNQPFGYAIEDKTIMIVKKAPPAPVVHAITPPLIDIRGKVVNENNDPVPAVAIMVKGTSRGTFTDLNGEFNLKWIDAKGTLLFRGTHIEPYECPIDGRKEFFIKVNSHVSKLDEVQIQGYTQTTRRLNTGNITTIRAAEIERQPVNNVLMALQGQVPGMDISQNTGVPGGSFQVTIRGRNSINAQGPPLYIVDGVPYPAGRLSSGTGYILNDNLRGGDALNFLDPMTIASVDVLKDADATAIYGSRGANGVVIITTRKGMPGRTRVGVDAYTGVGSLTRLPVYLDTKQYLEMRHGAKRNDGNFPIFPTEYDMNGVWDTTRYTNFVKDLLDRPAHYNDIRLSVSGGNDNTTFLLSGGFHKESTVFPGTGGDQMGSIHFNVDNTSPNKKFHAQLSGSYVLDQNTVISAPIFLLLASLPPDAPAIHNPDGSLNFENGTFNNPYSALNQTYKGRTSNLVLSTTLGYQLLKDLNVKVTMGLTDRFAKNYQGNPITMVQPSNAATFTRFATFQNLSTRRWSVEPQVSYSKQVRRHNITAMVGATWQQNLDEQQGYKAVGYSSDQLLENVTNASELTATDGFYAKYKYFGAFSRITYNFAEKYLLNLSGRYDGSSRFGPDRQFHFFGAVSGGWIFTEEKFLKNKIGFLSNGKLRASYGTVGSDALPDYRFMEVYNSATYPYQGAQGLFARNLYNPELSWEQSTKLEVGLSLGFFKDRIEVEVSRYKNLASKQLIPFSLSTITGFSSILRNLDAVVQNKGWEIQLNTVNVQTRNFSWRTGFNITSSRNMLKKFPGGAVTEGQPLNLVQLYNYAGVDPETGLFTFLDAQGKKTSNPQQEDRNILLQVDPRYYGGFTNSLQYKGFALDVLFIYKKQQQRNSLYGQILPTGFATNVLASQALGAWQKPGDITDIQKYSQNFSTFNTHAIATQSTRVWGDGSFVRLRNLSFSYTFNQAMLKRIRLQNLRLYVRGENLLLFTPYKDFDPEIGPGSIPPVRVLTAGLQVTL